MTTKVLFGGDSHGDLNYLKILIDKAIRFEVKIIFLLGDFGYWEHSPDGVLFLDRLHEALLEADVELIFLDGNHDNHPLLWNTYHETDEEGFVIVRPNVKYSPRGHSWTWGITKFLSIGGAYSIDKEWRVEQHREVIMRLLESAYTPTEAWQTAKPYEAWWETELITPDDVERCMKVGKVDVMLSHDVGTDMDMNTVMATHGRSNIKTDMHSYKNRMVLQDIVDAVNPDQIHHGHWHVRYRDKVHGRKYYGYDCNLRVQDAWGIVEFP